VVIRKATYITFPFIPSPQGRGMRKENPFPLRTQSRKPSGQGEKGGTNMIILSPGGRGQGRGGLTMYINIIRKGIKQ